MSAIDHDDVPTNTSSNPHFNDLVESLRSRRGFLKGGLGVGAVAFLAGGLSACGAGGRGTAPPGGMSTTAPLLGFAAVSTHSLDEVRVPENYRHAVFCRWGDPLFSDSPEWRGDATDTADAQALQFGDNHDGMHFYALDGSSTEGLLVMNHEYINPEYFFPAAVHTGETAWSLELVRKGQHGHGVSVAHVRLTEGNWQVVVPSQYNRRIHLNTPMQITGPARGHALMRTRADPAGERSLGTLNNCGSGRTIWGTYLTCEENFNGYFGTSGNDTRNANMRRYGLSARRSFYRWEEFDERFDYAQEPNEANRMGWVVEIDPFDPDSVPKKRTALGRIKHENAAQTLAADKRVVVYMGDDQANDYVYKFVSAASHVPGNVAANRDLLEVGTLYVARFGAGATTGDMMGTGEWLALVPATPTTDGSTLGTKFGDIGSILVNTRLAADAVGATPMDRPEWVTVHPATGEVYVTLTNNSQRTQADAVNPRTANIYGQIVRWREDGNDAAATSFEWDLFVVAGNPAHAAGGLHAGSDNVNAGNLFNSPDGLSFDADGRLWIQTDGNFSNSGNFANMGNNQMLAADPVTREIRRFLVGPSGCEITGATWTPDQKYMFINVQHPGEYGAHPNRPEMPAESNADLHAARNPLAFSTWPQTAGGRPRSATVVIWKEDGGKIGT